MKLIFKIIHWIKKQTHLTKLFLICLFIPNKHILIFQFEELLKDTNLGTIYEHFSTELLFFWNHLKFNFYVSTTINILSKYNPIFRSNEDSIYHLIYCYGLGASDPDTLWEFPVSPEEKLLLNILYFYILTVEYRIFLWCIL